MSLFNYNQFRDLIGVDISDSKIRYIQFQKKGKEKYHITAFNETSLESGLIQSGTVSDIDTVVHIVTELVAKPQFGKLQTKFVNFSVPEKRSFVKVVSIPQVPENERPGAVRWAIEQNIPVSIQEMNYDWYEVTPPNQAKQEDKIYCMVAVTPQSIVNTYTDIIKQAGLEPVSCENESVAITRSLVPIHTAPERSTMVVDLGRSRTNIMIHNNGAIQFSSTIEVSGNEMTRAVAKQLSLSFDDAEKIKILYGLDYRKGKGKIKAVLEPLMMQLVSRLREYIQYYNEYMQDKKAITELVLTGNVSKLHGVQEFFNKQLGLPIKEGDAYTNIRVANATRPDISKLNTSSYTTAIGLALKKIE